MLLLCLCSVNVQKQPLKKKRKEEAERKQPLNIPLILKATVPSICCSLEDEYACFVLQKTH